MPIKIEFMPKIRNGFQNTFRLFARIVMKNETLVLKKMKVTKMPST